MTYRHDLLLLSALTFVLSSACGGGSGADSDGGAGSGGAMASGGASGGGTGAKVSGGAGGGAGSSAGSNGPNLTRSLTTPDLIEGFWEPVRSHNDECAAPAQEDQTPLLDDLRFQNNIEQGYLEAVRCSGTKSCLQISESEYRFPIEQDGTVGEGIVIRGGQPVVEGEPCMAYRTRYFLILSADRQTLEHVGVGESGPGVIKTEECRYDHASDAAGFECVRREWVEYIRVSE